MPHTAILPNDQRYRQGGMLFLGTLFIFFASSLVLYGIYALTRQSDVQTSVPLPSSFLTSTVCLIGISGLVHWATRAIRRSRLYTTAWLLAISAIAGVLFMAVQYASMRELLTGPALQGGTGKGVAGMVVVLAFLHALHIAGGVISLGIVSVRAALGKYDRERHWPVDFAAQYWHFLDVIWLLMLGTFAMTTGGF